MTDLKSLSRPALAAAMRGGTAEWGKVGSSTEHVRYCEPNPKARRRCPCGCGNRASHKGLANGVCLTSGCELAVRRWVKTGSIRAAAATQEKT